MEITTNNIYSSLPTSQTATLQCSNDSFNTLLDTQSQDTTNNTTKVLCLQQLE